MSKQTKTQALQVFKINVGNVRRDGVKGPAVYVVVPGPDSSALGTVTIHGPRAWFVDVEDFQDRPDVQAWAAELMRRHAATLATMRTVSAVASDVARLWSKPYFGAVPYIRAMRTMRTADDMYGQDPGDSIIRYFLANATTFRGPAAKMLKAELAFMLHGEATLPAETLPVAVDVGPATKVETLSPE